MNDTVFFLKHSSQDAEEEEAAFSQVWRALVLMPSEACLMKPAMYGRHLPC